MGFSIRRRPESEAHALHRTLSGSVSQKYGALSAVRRCLASGFVLYLPAPGIIKRTPEKRESFFTG